MFKQVFCVYMCMFICVLRIYGQLEEGNTCVSEKEKLNGTCVSLRRCMSAVYEIKTKNYPQTVSHRLSLLSRCQTVLRMPCVEAKHVSKFYFVKAEYCESRVWRCLPFDLLCSFRGNEPIICCTDCELIEDNNKVVVDRYGYNYIKTGPKVVDKCIEYVASLNYSCNLPVGKKRELNYPDENCYTYSAPFFISVVGGTDAERGQFPHMALLGYGDTMEDAQWLCGGSVISDRFILTAAHCISSAALGPVKFIALGILKRSDPPETWQRYTVRRIISHPRYQSPNKYNDIALLETNERIRFSNVVLPACLNEGGGDESIVTATGWGALGHNKALADTLQVATLELFSDKECSDAYPAGRNLLNGQDPKTQACYGDKNNVIDTCQGDSGGPVHVSTYLGKCVYKIIGVTSFGRACGFVGNAGMYTRVSYYVPWIESIVWP